jgi:hypothetical protein
MASFLAFNPTFSMKEKEEELFNTSTEKDNSKFNSYLKKIIKNNYSDIYNKIKQDFSKIIKEQTTALELLETPILKDHLKAIGQYDRLQEEILTKNFEDLQEFNEYLDAVICDIENHEECYKNDSVYKTLEKKIKQSEDNKKLLWLKQQHIPLTIFLLDLETLRFHSVGYSTLNRNNLYTTGYIHSIQTNVVNLNYLHLLTNLKELSLENVELISEGKTLLPQKMPHSLEQLTLDNNDFQDIPDVIKYYNGLKKLTFSNQKELKNLNNIKILKNLENLATLEIDRNYSLKNIQSLHLKNLKKLYITKNKFLEELPDDICDLENLDTLDIQNNNIKNLPENFGDLKITHLNLNENPIKEFPTNFYNLSELFRIEIAATGFNEIPDEFMKLEKLYSIYTKAKKEGLTSYNKIGRDLKISEELKTSFKEKGVHINKD